MKISREEFDAINQATEINVVRGKLPGDKKSGLLLACENLNHELTVFKMEFEQ